MFGNNKIAELTAEVATLVADKAALIETNDGLQSDLADRDATDAIQIATLASNRTTIVRLNGEVDNHRVAGNVGEYALRQLAAVIDSGEIYISAGDIANKVVAKRLIDQTTAEQTDELLVEEEERQRDKYGPEQIEAIRARLNTIFDGDGTYTRLAAEIALETRGKVREDLIAEHDAKIRRELSASEVCVAMTVEVETELAENGTIDSMRAEQEGAARKQIELEAIERAKQRISDDLESQREILLAQLTKDWLAGNNGKQFKMREKKELTAELTQQGALAAAKRLRDEATVEILESINERTKEKILKDLVSDFLTMGTDVTKIQADNLVVIYLSNIPGEKPVKVPGDFYERQTYYDRKVELRSQGAGEYIVEYDSIVESKEPIDVGRQLTLGEVVTFGPSMNDEKMVKQTPFVTLGLPVVMTRNNKPGCTIPGVAVSLGINKEHIAAVKGLTKRPEEPKRIIQETRMPNFNVDARDLYVDEDELD